MNVTRVNVQSLKRFNVNKLTIVVVYLGQVFTKGPDYTHMLAYVNNNGIMTNHMMAYAL